MLKLSEMPLKLVGILRLVDFVEDFGIIGKKIYIRKNVVKQIIDIYITYIMKSKGPITLPCGILLVTGAQLELQPFTTTVLVHKEC